MNRKGYRNSESKDGRLSPKLEVEVTNRLRNYCKATNTGMSIVVNKAVEEYLKAHEADIYLDMDHATLAKLYVDLLNKNAS